MARTRPHPHKSIAAAERYHDALRRSDVRWAAAHYVGIQETHESVDYELTLSNCPICGSTLARRIPKRGVA